MGGAALLLFVAEFGFEFWRLGQPSVADMSWAGTNNAKLVDSLSPMARAYNNVLAMLVATVGLAIPLTANMHTPKLIELFLRDRINQWVLALMALGAANVLFVMYLIGPGFAPTWAYRFAVGGAIAGWIVVIPYFFYVVRFLDPSTIVARLQDAAIDVMEKVAEGDLTDSEVAQNEIQERLFQIGTLVIKSIGRADRSTAREGVWSFKRIMQRYGELKDAMGDDWFRVDRGDFIGASSHAIEMINRKQTWIETHTFQQLLLAYQNAATKAPDVVSSIANTVRIIARQAAGRGDRHVVSIGIRTMNSFLREAFNRGATRAAFDVLYQYREMASDIGYMHDHVHRIAGFFVTYADIASDQGHRLVARLMGFDLEHVMETAYEEGSPHADAILDMLLELDPSCGNGPEPMRVEVKILAGAYFLETKKKEQAEKVRAVLRNTDAELVKEAGERLTGIDKRVFWEMTDRAVNIEWTPKKRRRKIEKLLDSL